MLNLEWLRTFRAVYKTKSLSQASELLMISQPTVSQHLAALEGRMGKKLFERKSKGVQETDMGRILNTMISGSLESLEEVEHVIVKKDAQLKNILSIGISQHLYKSTLCNTMSHMGEYVHVKFGKKDELIAQVERGELLYAVIHERIERFDLYCHQLRPQHVVLTATNDLNLGELETLYQTDKSLAEKWLSNQRWYAHDHNSSFIKLYWLHVFDKKRPSIIPNYVIPNEYEVLYQQSNGSGLSIAFDNIASYFEEQGLLQTLTLQKINYRELCLIANKKKTDPQVTDKLVRTLGKDLVNT